MESIKVQVLKSSIMLLFFESKSNLIEGNLTLRQQLASVIRESSVRLRPGWRKYVNWGNSEPIELLVADMDAEEARLDCALQFYNRNPFVSNTNKFEEALIVIIREAT
jgi:hypothetical protein